MADPKQSRSDAQPALRILWDTMTSPVLRVLTEAGENVDNSQCRSIYGGYWLYVDGIDGYAIYTDDDVDGWRME